MLRRKREYLIGSKDDYVNIYKLESNGKPNLKCEIEVDSEKEMARVVSHAMMKRKQR